MTTSTGTNEIDAVDAGRHYLIHIDGACSGNPGPGGCGALLQLRDGANLLKEKDITRESLNTTNSRMELMSAIIALEALEQNGLPAIVVTDSAYVMDGITKWVAGWARNGWRKKDGRAAANVDLWERLVAAGADREVAWSRVRGHAGHPGNERADRLATKARDAAVAKARRMAA